MNRLARVSRWVIRQMVAVCSYLSNIKLPQHRVRLLPVMQKTQERDFGRAKNLEFYPKWYVERVFHQIIAEPSTPLRLLEREAWGYLKVSTEGVEEPDAPVLLLWRFTKNGVKAGIIFFDDEYYAVDTCNDRPEWVLKPGSIKYDTFNIRIYWKVRQ